MSCNNDFPQIYPHYIYFEGFQYSGVKSLPATYDVPSHWTCNPSRSFTTKDGMVMQCIDEGELIYNKSLTDLQIRNTPEQSNYSISWTTIGRENMNFEIRTRRLDENNFLSFEIDAENNLIQLKQTISDIETILTTKEYIFHHDILVVYEVSIITLNSYVYGYINGDKILEANTVLSPTYHGMSLYVPFVFDDDPVAFSLVSIQETTEQEDPILNNDNLLVMFRELIKNNIECPTHKDWETFKRAYELYHRFKDLGYKDATWTNFGYPIKEPKSQSWFGGD